MLNEELKKKIKEYCSKNSIDLFYYDSKTDIKNFAIQCLEKSDNINDFEMNALEMLSDSIYIEVCTFMKNICNDLNIKIEDNEEIVEFINNNIVYDNYINTLLDSQIKVNILCDFYNDSNTDFTSNGWMKWLLNSHGYKLSDFKAIEFEGTYNSMYMRDMKPDTVHYNKIYNSNNFIKSVFDECINMPNDYIRILTFCCTVTIRDYLMYCERKIKYIDIPKKCKCGLYNNWSGSGSLLKIALEHDVRIYGKNIASIQIDENGSNKHLKCGYTVNDTYGLIDSFWDTDVSVVYKRKADGIYEVK